MRTHILSALIPLPCKHFLSTYYVSGSVLGDKKDRPHPNNSYQNKIANTAKHSNHQMAQRPKVFWKTRRKDFKLKGS